MGQTSSSFPNKDVDYFTTQRGVQLHCRRWLPDASPRAIVVLAHGYGHHLDGYSDVIQVPLFTDRGIMVCGVSHFGHGYSEGLRCYIEDLDHVVNDFCDYALSVHHEFPDLPLFIIGQSMGGAIVMLSTLPESPLYGIAKTIMLCPMCQIDDEMVPPEWLQLIGKGLAMLFPTLPIAPIPSTIERAFKDPKALERACNDPLAYQQKPRLQTAWAMLNGTLKVQRNLDRYDAPFLVAHGDADLVTKFQASEALYNVAKSKDKEIKRYEGMYHALLSEPDGGAEQVSSSTSYQPVEPARLSVTC